MTTLTVHNFSCLSFAEVTLNRLTVLIGPQASGKSVVTKLIYFCLDILDSQFELAEEGLSLEQFGGHIAQEFTRWFPPEAWGKRKFYIYFTAGEFTIRIMRRMSKGRPAPSVAILFSDAFGREYIEVLEAFSEATQAEAQGKRISALLGLRRSWQVRSSATKSLESLLGSDYVSEQLFIPAGRSFFTSIGKAVAAFEQGGLLDPITVRFGRLFAGWRETGRGQRIVLSPEEPIAVAPAALMRELFGGTIRFSKDRDYVETEDGRRIPFPFLSSGQQELLPLWLALDNMALNTGSKVAVYIEEPEAHLFPHAQFLLVNHLAWMLALPKVRMRMVVTTHSPYVLSKLNNLSKAGKLGRRRALRPRVSEIIQTDFWLPAGSLAAYAFEDGGVRSLVDEDGLIDGAYLDSTSGEISREFSELLDVEFS